MSLIVVNMRNNPPAKTIYIGRRTGTIEGSPLGNPHRVGYCRMCKAVHKRGETIELYRAWLREEYAKKRNVYGALEWLADLFEAANERGEDLHIGCWCKPLACHGDVVKDAVEKIAAKRQREKEAASA